jgi:predicted dehydrogenase
MAEPIRLALAGAGVFARDAHVPAINALGDRFEIAAVYSRTRATAEALFPLIAGTPEVYIDLDAMLARPDIEAVDVILPIEALPEGIEKSLAAGKHVISEKPISADVATGRRLIEFARGYPQQVWMVAENYRYEPTFARASELVSSGAIGNIVMVHWGMHIALTPDNKYYQTAWRRSSTFPGGFLLDGGVHHVAVLRQIIGEVVSVSAEVRQMRSDLPPADTLSAVMQFENGMIGSYTVSYAAGVPFPTYLTISGDQGALRTVRGVVELYRGSDVSTERFDDARNVNEEFAAFADAIRLGKPHRNLPLEALRDVAVIEAMLKSAEQGRRVEVENLEDLEQPS